MASGGGGISKLQFNLGFFAFLGFLIFISNQSGLLFINASISAPPTPNILDVIGNVTYFFSALTVTSSYQLLYVLILTPLIIAEFWTIAEFLRGI